MIQNLTQQKLSHLIKRVFAPTKEDSSLFILVDVPNEKVPNSESWQDRRRIANEWYKMLQSLQSDLSLQRVELLYFENSGNNNADFPKEIYRLQGAPDDVNVETLRSRGIESSFVQILSEADLILAPTEFSATAPLKVFARKYPFRAASMPGFSRNMLPALSLDFDKIHEQVMAIKQRLDRATSIQMKFQVETNEFEFNVDTRYREGHASSGLLRERSLVSNLPSGESYIVPYEGELSETSLTSGRLPVQHGDDVVIYKVEKNRAMSIESNNDASDEERRKLTNDPAYGNIAEIGFGVLERFGVEPVGAVLLDEKLGLHIAFGRSDHFGGATSPQSFQRPENVVHFDHVYIKKLQPRIDVLEVVFIYPDGERETIIENSAYMI